MQPVFDAFVGPALEEAAQAYVTRLARSGQLPFLPARAGRWWRHDDEILVTGMLFAGNAGAAGVPALTIPNGRDPNSRPQDIILSGPYLSDPQRITVGYALEQALDGRVEPDLDATIAQIDAVTGK